MREKSRGYTIAFTPWDIAIRVVHGSLDLVSKIFDIRKNRDYNFDVLYSRAPTDSCPLKIRDNWINWVRCRKQVANKIADRCRNRVLPFGIPKSVEAVEKDSQNARNPRNSRALSGLTDGEI